MSEKKTREKILAEYQKLTEKAAKKRKVNRALREEYRDDPKRMATLREILTADLLRVFNDPCNPYAGWEASRQRYRELGHYPEIIITDVFGNHQEFQRAAGLRDSRGTAKVKNLLARVATEKQIESYAQECIEPYYGMYDKHLTEKSGIVRALVIGDVHGRFCDPFAWEVFLDVLKIVKPDLLVLNGDIADFPKVGRYTQIPGAGNLMLQAEIDFVRDQFKQIRKVYDGPLTWHLGNHEQRLARYLADCAPSLADLRCLRYDQLFGIEEFQIQPVFGGNWLAPYQSERSKNIRRTHKVYYDCFVVAHGTAMGPKGGMSEIAYFGMSGVSGHTHRPGIFMQGTEASPGLTWTNPGMMANRACAKDYRETRVNEWGMGLALFTIKGDQRIVIPELCIVNEELATFAGKIYTPTKRARTARVEMWD